VASGVQQLGLAADDRHETDLEVSGSFYANHPQGQRVGGRLQGEDLSGAFGAVAEMLTVGLKLVFGQSAEHV
jgi:hypothetical protein